MRPGSVLCRLRIRFESGEHLRADLSAAVLGSDGHLWIGADEMASVERFTAVDQRTYAEHVSFRLGDYLDLDDAQAEVDVEALEEANGYLWVLGSHSSKREKPKGKGAKALKRLATISEEPGRFVLARVPLVQGTLQPSGAVTEAPGERLDAAKVARVKTRGASLTNELFALLTDDEHLGPMLAARVPGGERHVAIPSKDNGLDIEGLTVCGDRVLLGLRGPVLRGWAVVLEVEPRASGDGELTLAPIGKGGERYLKHFLDLDGLGVRELSAQGDDVLVLAGPTMALDGAHRVYRYVDPAGRKKHRLVPREVGSLEALFDVPSGEGRDRPEGVAVYSYFDPDDSILVVYDDPPPERLYGDDAVLADVFRLR